jgi:hypothetical protein
MLTVELDQSLVVACAADMQRLATGVTKRLLLALPPEAGEHRALGVLLAADQTIRELNRT